ncbi:30S ribosomal protein S18 [Candidatus Falkowbacteria bacterium RIFOXYB2_FULL_34_18]|uniref:Small ribosomal subunit protein bS18 n=1 Tax=Candidatus Falkowbacteria bacterium RIFOXYD2_FULL_34_120 TaxID=1798007 RepID=A0A1F5TP62_9BACT|nr:MAG: 30S ribosomal protein S18 [Candidatus Falkowbacteria bacterium RIFOXYB2_FULL_34_18]OGF29021.1 MAG: 30S ribosomal protein S18 [Candidatus Falkowbacteria bacterium RIFOXYC12_FULL_34_55]OGF35962.1 MAG: 30S ribosomal protein S18 [Candidatus Falkowbacteria bacterium RIFOXYC2_FULL_34_220]OGF38508.1 MAG: 30S ribosomal protein S18 [Candidatus Falkowbacteria bacterium RIFOXYD12_FULL_34_57]OGF40670.1 MAG: 30S ribosomal protein S18 [Candidatus Falkowbacteria bacterium RIFOXYD2_FULL_34_120]
MKNNQNNDFNEIKKCYFCENDIHDIDYKDIRTIHRFINTYKKILPKRRTGTCSWHQRKLAIAIKRARIMALLPFIKQ